MYLASNSLITMRSLSDPFEPSPSPSLSSDRSSITDSDNLAVKLTRFDKVEPELATRLAVVSTPTNEGTCIESSSSGSELSGKSKSKSSSVLVEGAVVGAGCFGILGATVGVGIAFVVAVSFGVAVAVGVAVAFAVTVGFGVAVCTAMGVCADVVLVAALVFVAALAVQWESSLREKFGTTGCAVLYVEVVAWVGVPGIGEGSTSLVSSAPIVGSFLSRLVRLDDGLEDNREMSTGGVWAAALVLLLVSRYGIFLCLAQSTRMPVLCPLGASLITARTAPRCPLLRRRLERPGVRMGRWESFRKLVLVDAFACEWRMWRVGGNERSTSS